MALRRSGLASHPARELPVPIRPPLLRTLCPFTPFLGIVSVSSSASSSGPRPAACPYLYIRISCFLPNRSFPWPRWASARFLSSCRPHSRLPGHLASRGSTTCVCLLSRRAVIPVFSVWMFRGRQGSRQHSRFQKLVIGWMTQRRLCDSRQ